MSIKAIKLSSWQSISPPKQLLIIGLISIASLVTFTAWMLVARTQEGINRSVEQFGLALAQALARGGAEALSSTSNVSELKYYVLSEMKQTPSLVYVVFTSREGKLLLNSRSFLEQPDESGPIYPIFEQPARLLPGVYTSPTGFRQLVNIAVPVRLKNQVLGICWVGLDRNSFTILGTPKQARFFLLAIFSLVGLLGTVGLAANYALINRPLKALAQGATEIAGGHFGHQISTQKAGKEIDQVVNAFNYMSNQLKQYDREHLQTLMSERNKFISEKNKLELVLMSIADGVVVLDRDNQVQIINAAATQLFDKDPGELLGKPLVFCTQGPESPKICQVIQAFTDSLSPQQHESVVQQVHLGERIIRLNIAPLLLQKEFLGSVMIMQDITRQLELDRMKSEFVSNVSHELRTPITSIKSYSDTLCNHGEKLDPDIYREFLQIINNEADRLIYLVNEVLDLSRLEEGEWDAERTPLDICIAIEHALKSINLMAQDRQIAVAFKRADYLPLVNINQDAIERCVINLLSNAIKYTPVGGQIAISASYETESTEVKVSVADNGIGIPEDCLEQIFDRFYRVEYKVHTIKGTGLGLTIVKKIVEQHGGRVTCESSLGHGSTFSMILPACEAEVLPAGALKEGH